MIFRCFSFFNTYFLVFLFFFMFSYVLPLKDMSRDPFCLGTPLKDLSGDPFCLGTPLKGPQTKGEISDFQIFSDFFKIFSYIFLYFPKQCLH